MTQTETALQVQAALRGEQLAFRRLFEAHSGAVFATAMRFTGNAETAEELTQDTFLRAFNALDTYDDSRAQFATWLQRIAYNTCVSHLRRQPPPSHISLDDSPLSEGEMPDSISDEPAFSADESRTEQLMRALESLPPEERHLLTLFYFEQRTLNEIGYIMRLSNAALSSRLNRIRKKLYLKLTT
ncbi:MAG: RNA polymerase sigma factor [Bacteroidaceae bacterium]|nr:RNA polymerase sigma factor [Bacteroidaceae bacterium]